MAENLGESKKRSRVMYGQSLAFARDDLRLTTIMPQAYHSCTGGEKWLWAPLEEALSQPFLWNVPPISPHELLLPSHQPSQPRKGNTPPINTRACVRVCVSSPLCPAVSLWLGCGGSSAPCNRAELCFSYTLFSTCPQVLTLGKKGPTYPLQR